MASAKRVCAENAGVIDLPRSYVCGMDNTLWTEKRNQCRHLSRRRFQSAG